MEAGAFFLLAIFLIVVVALGALVYGTAAWLRRRKLDPERDKIEYQPREQSRPRHVRHGRSQRAHFFGG
jgi:hypothetical protein